MVISDTLSSSGYGMIKIRVKLSVKILLIHSCDGRAPFYACRLLGQWICVFWSPIIGFGFSAPKKLSFAHSKKTLRTIPLKELLMLTAAESPDRDST